MDPKTSKKNEEAKQHMMIITSVVTSLERIFARQSKIDDQCMRYCLFVDKFSMALDILIAFATSSIYSNENFPDELKDRVDKLSKTLLEELENLMTYCRAPSFSPDAPFGHHLVETTTFMENAQINDSDI